MLIKSLKSISFLKPILVLVFSVLANNAFSSYFWQITQINSIDSGGTYCQNSTPNPIHLNVIQCAGGGSKPHNSTYFSISWYKNSNNLNSGGQLVSKYTAATQHAYAFDILFNPPTSDSGTFFYYAVISNPSNTSCGFTDSLISQTVQVNITAAPSATFKYADKLYCSASNNPSASITGQTGGKFFSNTIVNLDSMTGEFNPSIQSLNAHEISYTVLGLCNGYAADTIEIISQPDTSIYLDAYTLKANDTSLNYIWKNCSTNQVIPNEINYFYTPNVNGSYAVELSKGACVVQSSCFNYIKLSLDNSSLSSVKIFPNPNNGQFSVQINNAADFVLYDVTGKVVRSGKIDNIIQFQNLNIGVYTLTLLNKNEVLSYKIVIQ